MQEAADRFTQLAAEELRRSEQSIAAIVAEVMRDSEAAVLRCGQVAQEIAAQADAAVRELARDFPGA